MDAEAGVLVGWFQHRDYVWQQAPAVPGAVSDIQALFPGFHEGEYSVTFWDVEAGRVVGDDRVRVDEEDQGTLAVNLLPISRTLAIYVEPDR